MTPTQALRQCLEAMKLVDFKDCAESEELWHKFNLAQANAERLLRDGEKQEPAVNAFDAMTKYSGASIATTYWMEQEDFYLADDVKAAIAAHPAPSLQAVGAVPEGYALVPLVATDDMIVAFAEQWYSKRQVIDDPDMADAYKAMLASAPQPAAAPLDENELVYALRNIRDYRTDVDDTIAARSMRFYAEMALEGKPAAAPSGDVERDAP